MKASVLPSIEQGAVGWHLDQFGWTLVDITQVISKILAMTGLFGAVKLATLVDLAAPFHEFEGESQCPDIHRTREKSPIALYTRSFTNGVAP